MIRNLLRVPRRRWLAVALALCIAGVARAAAADLSDCGALADVAERESGLPHGLLSAIGQVETGRPNPQTGRIEPWPWSTNMAGIGHYFSSAAEAIAWTAAQQRSGQTSIDVGCFQINLKYHPNAFASLEEAFDPASNARYAASFLNALYARVGNWQLAAAQYHSADPLLGGPYGSRVFALLDAGDRPQAGGITASMTAPSARPSVRMPSFAFGIQVIVPSWAMADQATRPSVASIRPIGGLRYAAKGLDNSPIRVTDHRLPRVFTPS
jgi:soluble lytic murein transglycosylase-like protein